MKDALLIRDVHQGILTELLDRFLPRVSVWAYGSRVNGRARENSDLDLVVFTRPEQRAQVAELREELRESNLPFLVDLHVWDELPEIFQENIRKEHLELRSGPPRHMGGL